MLRELIYDYSLGNNLRRFWRLFYRRERAKSRFLQRILTFLINRSAQRLEVISAGARKLRASQVCPTGCTGYTSPAMQASAQIAVSIRA